MAATITTAIQWDEIIPGVYQAELDEGMSAEIITGSRDSWEIYDFEGNVIAEGYGHRVSDCKINISQALKAL